MVRGLKPCVVILIFILFVWFDWFDQTTYFGIDMYFGRTYRDDPVVNHRFPMVALLNYKRGVPLILPNNSVLGHTRSNIGPQRPAPELTYA